MYSSAESGLIQSLLADTAITAICGTRVYPAFKPTGAALPAVIIGRAATDRAKHATYSDVDMPEAILNIYCVATSYNTACELAHLIVLHINRLLVNTTLGNHTLVQAFVSDESDEFVPSGENDAGAYLRVLEITLTYRGE